MRNELESLKKQLKKEERKGGFKEVEFGGIKLKQVSPGYLRSDRR